MKDFIYLWNCSLSWELFTSSVYAYKQALTESRPHKRSFWCKNGVFNAVTSIEAYANEVLIKEFDWGKDKLNKTSIRSKLGYLGVQGSNSSRKLRNDFLVHHKRPDHLYFNKFTIESLLQAIEATQEVIANICFNRKQTFPYWITGLNFTDKREKDIFLDNNSSFWLHILSSKLFPMLQDKINPFTGELDFVDSFHELKKIYQAIWFYPFDVQEIEVSRVSLERFPKAPVLTSNIWN